MKKEQEDRAEAGRKKEGAKKIKADQEKIRADQKEAAEDHETEDSRQGRIISDQEIAEIISALRERGETVTTVESLTAGMISARLADIPGCSDVMERAYVTYCDQAKHEMVKVKKKTLEKWTAVSRQCAKQMAKGGAGQAGACACVSATGYAGPPSGPEDRTAGLVYLGCHYRGETVTEEHHYAGQRNEVRAKAMNDALRLLYRMVIFSP